MKTNENLGNVISLPEINNLEELAKDCNKAVVTYGLKEQLGKYKMCKMVVLYSDELDMETIVSTSNLTMMKHDVSLSKPFIYRITGSIAKRLSYDFVAALFKPIFGIINNDRIHDCTREYSRYKRGGYND